MRGADRVRSRKKKALPYEVRRIIEYKLCRINETKRELRAYKLEMIPSSTPAYSGMPGSSDPESRPTEKLAVKMTTDAYIMEMEKTVKAFDKVLNRLNSCDRKLIKLVYWDQSHTKEGAALACHLSKTAVYDRINSILEKLAVEMGYINLR